MPKSPSPVALLGGTPVRPEGPPDWPLADEEVREALEAAYRDGSWGKYHGRYVERLEGRLADYHGGDFALSCASGTYAVELALRALKVGPGDEVVLAAYEFPGNFETVLAVGARPVLVDVAAANWNLAAEQLAGALNSRTRAVIATHLHGGVVPMQQVVEVARRGGLGVVEDAAQMPGAVIQGRKVGTWGDIGVLSFGGSKLLSAGRGGAIITAREDLHHRARLASWRGNRVAPLSELQAAVLLPQLEKLDARNRRRGENVALLVDGLRELPLAPLANHTEDTQPGYYKLGLRYDAKAFGGLKRERFVTAMRAEGIAVDAGFRGLHRRSASRCRKVTDLTESGRAATEMVVLHHPVLLGGLDDIEAVVEAVRKVHRAVCAGELC